jgi:HAD superfamily hydrolase (TIGR01490 family)
MKAAFFDLDKTLIAKSSIIALGPELHARGFIHRSTLVRSVGHHLLFNLFGADQRKMEKIRTTVGNLSVGWDSNEVRRMVEETITSVIEPLIYAEALELIDQHQAAGDEVWVVSASPEDIVIPFVHLLGLTGAIATRPGIDKKGRYTGKIDFYCQGDQKAEAIRALAAERGINLAESSAYSDSGTDVPMLESVGRPFCVNPDRDLTKVAQIRQWPIVVFTHPVRPSDRRRSHTPYLLGVAVVGGLALMSRLRRGKKISI